MSEEIGESAAELYQEALAWSSRQDHEVAVSFLKRSAELGHPTAKHLLVGLDDEELTKPPSRYMLGSALVSGDPSASPAPWFEVSDEAIIQTTEASPVLSKDKINRRDSKKGKRRSFWRTGPRSKAEVCKQEAGRTNLNGSKPEQSNTAAIDARRADEGNATIGAAMSKPNGSEQDLSCWCKVAETPWMVRGSNYLRDGRKVRATTQLFSLVGVDLLSAADSSKFAGGAAVRPESKLCSLRSRGDNSYAFVVSFLLPVGGCLVASMCFSLDDDTQFDQNTPSGKLSRIFFKGNDNSFRDDRLKIIPTVCEGPWMIREAVGQKPAIVGKRLQTTYFQTPNYLEIFIDLTASAFISTTVNLCCKQAEELIVDVAFLIEGKRDDELPEEILGSCRFDHISLSSAKQIR